LPCGVELVSRGTEEIEEDEETRRVEGVERFLTCGQGGSEGTEQSTHQAQSE